MLHLIFNIFLEFTENRKLKTEALPGGGREIRTPGPLKVCGFQDRRLKPLGHPSRPKFLPSAPRDVNLGGQEGGRYVVSGKIFAIRQTLGICLNLGMPTS